jgi:predicted Fe-Mo cluster-binding NifX family protein
MADIFRTGSAWTIRAAFATDDGVGFMDRHFGDAAYFDIYDIDESSMNFVQRIINSMAEDKAAHADTAKAGGITGLLKQKNVNTAVSKVFGPNIMRIKKNFVCLRMDDPSIAAAGARLRKYYARIREEWEKGEDRTFLNLLLTQETVED